MRVGDQNPRLIDKISSAQKERAVSKKKIELSLSLAQKIIDKRAPFYLYNNSY